MVDWPISLPDAFLMDGYSETEPDTAIWSQPEAGAAIGRRRATYGVMPFGGAMMLTTAQKATLRSFWRDVLASGTAEFNMPAQDGTSDRWVSRMPKPPSYEPVSNTHWRASVAMELMPGGVIAGPAATGIGAMIIESTFEVA